MDRVQTRTVTLGPAQYAEAVKVGIARDAEHPGEGSLKGPMSRVAVNLLGAIGEMGLVVRYGLEWDGRLFTFAEWKAGKRAIKDVCGVDVKATKYPFGRLIVKVEDQSAPDDPIALARVDGKTVTFPGWAYAREIKAKLDATMPTPCYVLDNSLLRPMSELEEIKGWEPVCERALQMVASHG